MLCWGSVITFFSMPIVVFGLQALSEEPWVRWSHFNEHLKEFGWLADVYKGITALVFGLAGLNSFDKRGVKDGRGQD